MTRTHAMKRLLEHGPMQIRDICDCTRWPQDEVDDALWACIEAGEVRVRMVRDTSLQRNRVLYEAVVQC